MVLEADAKSVVTAEKIIAVVCRNGYRLPAEVKSTDEDTLVTAAETAEEDVCWHQDKQNGRLTILLRVKSGPARGILRLREGGKPGALPFTGQALRGLVGIPHLAMPEEAKLTDAQLTRWAKLIMNGEEKSGETQVRLANGKRLTPSK